MKRLASTKLSAGLRWVFNGLAALSLLLWVATIVAWIRSEFYYDKYFQETVHRDTGNMIARMVITDDGRLVLYVEHNNIKYFKYPDKIWGGGWTHNESLPASKGLPHGEWDDVRWYWYSNKWFRPGFGKWLLIVRIWTIVVLTALLPLIWLWQSRRHGPAPGFCATCGYDLRATPERCPECGTIAAKNETVAK